MDSNFCGSTHKTADEQIIQELIRERKYFSWICCCIDGINTLEIKAIMGDSSSLFFFSSGLYDGLYLSEQLFEYQLLFQNLQYIIISPCGYTYSTKNVKILVLNAKIRNGQTSEKTRAKPEY